MKFDQIISDEGFEEASNFENNGRFQTLFRESVKFWNFGKMFGASDFSLKITPKSRI